MPLKGETQWNWRVDPRGRFHVYVEYENEILVLGAIRVAEKIIQALDSRKVEGIDVEVEIDQLRELYKLSERYRVKPPCPSKPGWSRRWCEGIVESGESGREGEVPPEPGFFAGEGAGGTRITAQVSGFPFRLRLHSNPETPSRTLASAQKACRSIVTSIFPSR